MVPAGGLSFTKKCQPKRKHQLMGQKLVRDMTPEEHEAFKLKKREAMRRYRASFSDDKKATIRQTKREKAKVRYANLTPAEKSERAKIQTAIEKATFEALPDDEKQAVIEKRRLRDRNKWKADSSRLDRQREYRKKLTPEQKAARLKYSRVESAKKRAAMTAEDKRELTEYKRQYVSKRRKADPAFRVQCDIRSRLRHAADRRHTKRTDLKTSEMLGCTWEQFAKHLENQFDDRMTWDNKGRYTWHIDHIVPLAAFDLSKDNEARVAANYMNHQPMWHDDNMAKADKLPTASSLPTKLRRLCLALDAKFFKRKIVRGKPPIIAE